MIERNLNCIYLFRMFILSTYTLKSDDKCKNYQFFTLSWSWHQNILILSDFLPHLMVYLPRYGFAQTHYLKYRLRLTHRKRKKGNWMSLSPPPLLLKIGYFWSIKLRWGRWKNYLMTNFLGWELFISDGSMVGTLGTCISQNVPILGIANPHI